MIAKLVMAFLIAIAVGFGLAVILGPLLDLLSVPPATFFGGILVHYGWPIGFFVGLWWYFFSGGGFGFRRL